MIRWITAQLGTAAFTDPAIGSDLAVLDVRDLVDKQGNTPKATREKIRQGLELLRQERRLVVCCDYGISRSNAIAAGILSQLNNISLEAAARQVIQATGEQEIKLEPLAAVRTALAKKDGTVTATEPRVLITGGSGFVGSRLQTVLGNELFHCAPTRSAADLLAGALELDLLVKEQGINCIVHLANPRVYTSNRALGETVTMLRNVLEVCRDNGLRLIYPSSWEIYSGYRSSELHVHEGMPPFAKGPYGETKYLCEQLIDLHRIHYGLEYALLRSCPLYGEGSDRPKFIYNFLAKALRNDPIYTHHYLNGEPRLDLLYVDDFVDAIVKVLYCNFVGSINIGSGLTVSTYDVARWVVRQCNSSSHIEKREIDEYSPNINMGYQQAEKKLGWRPQVCWQDGLSRIVEGAMAGHLNEDRYE